MPTYVISNSIYSLLGRVIATHHPLHLLRPSFPHSSRVQGHTRRSLNTIGISTFSIQDIQQKNFYPHRRVELWDFIVVFPFRRPSGTHIIARDPDSVLSLISKTTLACQWACASYSALISISKELQSLYKLLTMLSNVMLNGQEL
jgi:hypothetical protein